MIAQNVTEHGPSSIFPPPINDNNYDIILTEEICPPYYNPPSPIQEIPKEQIP